MPPANACAADYIPAIVASGLFKRPSSISCVVEDPNLTLYGIVFASFVWATSDRRFHTSIAKQPMTSGTEVIRM